MLLDTAARMFEQEAASKGIELRVRYLPASCDLPPLVLMRILTNLLSNAIKHCDHGRILLSARRRGENLLLELRDTGIGMDAETLARVQLAYQKGADSSGEGLGLAICHQLADAHGIDFEIASHPGRGTCCRLRIPAIFAN